ncbi:Exodeoxyribonuclease VII large subunit [Sulfobacillus thermosulfidooxidans DSM 9293]|uniref:Exodeoxyribonuclease 7 large subunit n=2 Tax=Sulfobacillus thermosulfidooxidans TaxID=28034 RepID=A0A1W1WIU0_SULTA|nr:exodeoxyribonuclease VII large subunit [Sulfobacillus thermosulfidooxidans]PSR29214.1 MAG: exodeoxyribonuclease VII large subunit [Sulfobacillus thermosulfidooxidans]SMC06187.1 Exodeoxyribonuclease VII large subunit [Sulfobacillus thermosulfidooxidans DSM 9293]
MTESVLSVHELVQGIRKLVENVPEWQRLWVQGELSGVKHHSSGHWYFILKDDQAQIRGVMFRRDAVSLTKPLVDGMSVLVYGRIGVFERDGQTQLYASVIQDLGAGAQFQKLEALKQKLYQEGLFSRPKRPIPKLPRAIGVITSGTGAARYDIETVINRRFPGMPVWLFPVLVQGQDAPRAIVEALQKAFRTPISVLIIGRGGGSKEDLMAFNDEMVVRTVAKSPMPVISAVGHEIDTTLVDLVADLRAPTPSAAAELAVPEKGRLMEWIDQLNERVYQALSRRLEWERTRIEGWTTHGILADSSRLIITRRDLLDRLDERRDRAFERMVQSLRLHVEKLAASLAAMNPSAVLRRGYTYVLDESGNTIGKEDVRQGQRYEVHWYNGSYWMRSETPGKEEDA